MTDAVKCTCGVEIEKVMETVTYWKAIGTGEVAINNHRHEPSSPAAETEPSRPKTATLPELDVTYDEHFRAFEEGLCPDDPKLCFHAEQKHERLLCRERQLLAALEELASLRRSHESLKQAGLALELPNDHCDPREGPECAYCVFIATLDEARKIG